MANRFPLSRLLQKSGGSNDVGKCDWLSVLSLTADWSIDCGSGLSLRGPGGAAVSSVWRRSELPNLKQCSRKYAFLRHVPIIRRFVARPADSCGAAISPLPSIRDRWKGKALPSRKSTAVSWISLSVRDFATLYTLHFTLRFALSPLLPVL